MGFLSVLGGVLTFDQYKDKLEQFKKHGLMQFVALYDANKGKEILPLDKLKWGEEMEYQLYYNDKYAKRMKMSNKAFELIQIFNNTEVPDQYGIILLPEFGGWMIEAVPVSPYQSQTDANVLLSCIDKLHCRRMTMSRFFDEHNLSFASLSNVPILGTPDHIDIGDEQKNKEYKQYQNDLPKLNKSSQSKFVLDSTCNPHPRFAGLVQSIRERRGEKVDIRVPIFKDKNTNLTEATPDEPYPGYIYMDAMHFGMGQCCLQITYECATVNHARYLYDMLLPFTGIMAALSASSPIQKGQLSDQDLRWTVIEQSVDCRTKEERDPSSDKHIPKSRYSSINSYISNHEYVKDQHNDAVEIKYNPEYKKLLQSTTEIDDRLAEHIARLFTRDPVPAYEGEFMEDQIDDKNLSAHFENFQSTNWNSLRFKPPPSTDSDIGWRVEFRTMDIQITDWENTTLIVTLGLIVNVINHFDVNFIMPVTLCDQNMDRAHSRNAILEQKFWFKTSCVKDMDTIHENNLLKTDFLKSSGQQAEEKYEELYIHEILNGKQNFPGIINLIRKFMQIKKYSSEHVQQIETYLQFLIDRANGKVPTGARFIRDYITNHPLYLQDSKIDSTLNWCMMQQILKMNCDYREKPENEQSKGIENISTILDGYWNKMLKTRKISMTREELEEQKYILLEVIKREEIDEEEEEEEKFGHLDFIQEHMGLEKKNSDFKQDFDEFHKKVRRMSYAKSMAQEMLLGRNWYSARVGTECCKLKNKK